jgi:hypothetical protein
MCCDILETATNQLIETNIPSVDAKERCRDLNFGAVFDGWTPSFFLTKTRKLENA